MERLKADGGKARQDGVEEEQDVGIASFWDVTQEYYDARSHAAGARQRHARAHDDTTIPSQQGK